MKSLSRAFTILLLVAFVGVSLPSHAHSSALAVDKQISVSDSGAGKHDCGHGHLNDDGSKGENSKELGSCCAKMCKCASGSCANVKAMLRTQLEYAQFNTESASYLHIEGKVLALAKAEILRPPQS